MPKKHVLKQHNSRKEPEDKLESGRGTKETGMGSKLLDRWLRSRWQRTLALRWLRWIVTANFSESSMQVSSAGHLRLPIKAIEFSIWSFVVGTFLNHRATVSELFELSSSCLCSCKYLGKLSRFRLAQMETCGRVASSIPPHNT